MGILAFERVENWERIWWKCQVCKIEFLAEIWPRDKDFGDISFPILGSLCHKQAQALSSLG